MENVIAPAFTTAPSMTMAPFKRIKPSKPRKRVRRPTDRGKLANTILNNYFFSQDSRQELFSYWALFEKKFK
jgi:hypothetical protein